MARPRIGVDFHTWDGIHQGTRSHFLGIFSEAVALAPEIDFCFFADQIESLRAEWSSGNRENVFFIRMITRPGLFRLLIQLPFIMHRHKLDLMHLQYGIPPIHGHRCVTTIHDILFESHPHFFGWSLRAQLRISCRFAARHARSVFTVSEYSRHELQERYGLDPQKIVLTPNGVDIARFSPDATPFDSAILGGFNLQSGKYILTVGRLEPRKNHITLIKAIIAANLRDLPLVIVGQRYYFGFEEVQQEIIEARAKGYDIRLLENVNDDALPVLMRHCVLFAFLSFAEGFGMPPLEAMACGAPVLVSKTTAMPEVVGDAGILVNPTEVPEIAAALLQLMENELLRDRLASHAKTQVERFQWRESARTLVSEYRRLLGLPTPC